MSEAELKLVELDPNKQYVVMFKGGFEQLKWPDKPANVSDIILNADHFTIEDIEKARETLPNADVTKLEDSPDVKLAIDKAVAAYEQKIQEFAVETLVHSKVFEWAESNSFPHRNQNPHVGGEGLGYQSAQQYVLDQLPIWRAEALAALQLKKEENK